MRAVKARAVLLALLLFLISSAGGCGSGNKDTGSLPYLGDRPGGSQGAAKSAPAAQEAPTGEKIDIVLYFGTSDGYLAAEMRSIPKTQGIARAAVQELIRGPAPGSGLYPTLPPGTSLNGIKIEGGTATVDFSKELKTGHKGGSSGEMVTVSSIVNTLTQFPAVQRVQILIDGSKVETLAGHLDISGPLGRNANIIRQKQGTN